MKTKIANPVLPGFHPDPSILRVGDDYYIANSSFEWYPGVRIHHSRDLVTWEVVAQPLDTLELLDMIGNESSGGIWAPCLSHDGEKFYLIYTDVKSQNTLPFKDVNNYLTTSVDIKGPWSKPIYMNSSGFDASLFHEGDKKWYVNMEWDYRKTDLGDMFTGILLQEFDAKAGRLLGKPLNIFKGPERQLVEGPHLYKKDGYYYLLTAEGGTSYAHAVTIARSTSIEGPYEIHPNKHLISSKDTDRYIQKAGHGSLVETQDGKWYLAFLGGRPIKDTGRCILGRETSIQEVIWKDGWPYLANGTISPDDFYEVEGEIEYKQKGEVRYSFDNFDFLNDFNTLRRPIKEDTFSISEKTGYLTITGKESILSKFDQALIARRQTDMSFTASFKLEFESDNFQRMAGMTYRYDEHNQFYFYMSYDETLGGNVLRLIKMDAGIPTIFDKVYPACGNTVNMMIKVDQDTAQFYYSVDEENYMKAFDVLDATILSDDYAQPLGFTGAFIGMACQDMVDKSAKAHFTEFVYTPR